MNVLKYSEIQSKIKTCDLCRLVHVLCNTLDNSQYTEMSSLLQELSTESSNDRRKQAYDFAKQLATRSLHRSDFLHNTFAVLQVSDKI
jgi:hypothetical protein